MSNFRVPLKQSATITLLSIASFAVTGCGNFFNSPSGSPPPAGASFTIFTDSAEYTRAGVFVSRQGVGSQPVAGHYVQNVSGLTPSGGGTNFGYNAQGNIAPVYTGSGGFLSISGADLNTTWDTFNYWTPVGCQTSIVNDPPGHQIAQTETITPNETLDVDCPYVIGDTHPQVSPQFAIAGQTGSTFTEVASTPLSTAYGMPQLVVLDKNNSVVATMNATSIAADGVTATFPYPTGSSGSALPSGLYSTNILNITSGGGTSYAGGLGGLFSIASMSTSYTSAFGVAAANTSTLYDVCITIPASGHNPSQRECNDSTSQASYPLVTLSTQNEVSINGTLLNVGVNPTAIVAYGTNSKFTSSSSPNTSVTSRTTGTGYALVTNTGSGTVSVVDVLNKTVLATIVVGNKPVAAVVTPDNSTAYVANYTDGTISKINLSSYAVTATQAVGPMPAAVDLDASGNVWVGGAGYLTELNPTSLAVLATQAQNGNVTTMAISKQLNSVAATVVANSSGIPSGTINYNSATATTKNGSLQSGGTSTSSAAVSAQSYGTSTAGRTVATPAQMANGVLVSANYGNALSVALTTAGFTVQDLSGNVTFLSGTLPSVGRGLAVDPDYGYVYITLPDSNAVLTVPLPNEPTD